MTLSQLTGLCISLVFGALFAGPVSNSEIPITGFDLPLKSSGPITFHLDVCQLEGRDNLTTVELCYSLDLQQFSRTQNTPDSLRFNVDLFFLNTQLEVVNHISERKAIAYPGANPDNEALTFVDLKKFLITTDTLVLRLKIIDPLTTRSGEIETGLVGRKFGNRLSLSDVIFISSIQRPGELTHFLRAGLTMIPNPSRFYRLEDGSGEAPVYFEINNLSYSADEPSAYSLNVSVSDLSGKNVLSKSYAALPVKSANTSRIEKIDISGFDTGIYRLELRISDLASGINTTAKKYFQVFSSEQNKSLLLPMTEADVEKYLDQIKYIASKMEKKVFLELDPAGKQAFLLQFWKSRDPVPQTPENEFMTSYFTKIAYCDANFPGGINSDRGRIYMQYGAPLDIERRSASRFDSKPVQIWTYAIDGTTEFVFVDRLGGDQFVLVHSNHPDEYQNPDWQKQLD